jgi:DNA polymerase III delta prime subunit
MENMNSVLDRELISVQIKQLLVSFDEKRNNVNFNKGIYIYGTAGSGKTRFVSQILEELNYDIVKFDAGDVRNSALVDTLASNSMSSRNVLQMMNKKVKKIVVVMDELDGMNSGDKGGLTSLIKLIRQKKTKKQKLEDSTVNPIICIGNYFTDKKIKELMKVCNVFELKTPTHLQMSVLLDGVVDVKLQPAVLDYMQGDLRKLQFVLGLASKNSGILSERIIRDVLAVKSHNEDSKRITRQLINHAVPFDSHNTFINETDRTIVALLWHENIIDAIDKHPPSQSFPFYLRVLDNICYADYIDRITFQHQIWQFSEMSSMMKTFYNNRLYHEAFTNTKFVLDEVRFTKILTKYSTEYNNMQFVFTMCQELDMDRKDLIAFFQELRLKYGPEFQTDFELIERIFYGTEVGKLDVKRMYRYLDKNVKKTAVDEEQGEP